MVLIADSGSSNTTWNVTENKELILKIETSGINPFYQTTGEIQELILTSLLPKTHQYNIEAIFFYGAGCAFPEKKKTVSEALSYFYPDAKIEVESDLLGGARALFQHEKGIACILGTGSNSCYYDGTHIIKNVSPLGFILGDEGSGAVLGKLLIADCMKKQLPEWLCDKLIDEYELSQEKVMDAVYKNPFPSKFLASFAPFMAKHIEEPAIFNLIFDNFDAFFTRNVMQYDLTEMKVGFVGSVAYYFKDTLEIVASERNIFISQILQSPMEGLIQYHS
ncbi:MAG: ATPase [Paludibacter sp.]|nr:ATPase [Paludibacter sp.]MDD4198414.1 ATPase [Paludibacter sp.]MDD4427092.1 ATPase [Paludibacter sp.]